MTLYPKSSTYVLAISFLNFGIFMSPWNANEDTLYFSAGGTTLNTYLDTADIFKIAIGSITTGSPKIAGFAPKLLKTKNFPNPFREAISIAYVLPADGYVAISIYNAKGELIKVLGQEKQNKGSHSIVWDGKDYMGNSMTSGEYFYQIISGDLVTEKKIILIK